VIAIYGIVFYRFWSKNRLRKSMDTRDRARTDLYLAQLRTQSAPNTPGFAQTPRTPGFPTMIKTPMDAYSAAEQGQGRATSPTFITPTSAPSNTTASPFRLQAPPIRVTKATPTNTAGDGFSPSSASTERYPSPSVERYPSPPMMPTQRAMSPPMSPPPEERVHEHMSAAPGETQYAAVPIPGASYVNQPGQAF